MFYRQCCAKCVGGNHLALFLFVLVLFTASPMYAQSDEWSSRPDKDEILDLINEQRSHPQQCGDEHMQAVEPVSYNLDLFRAASKHTRDMVYMRFFSHENKRGEGPKERIEDYTDEFTAFGENIARGQRSLQAVVESWMNSPGHCKNIMNPEYTHVGLATQMGTTLRNDESVQEPYWTMKLARGIREISYSVEHLELDQQALIARMNIIRDEGATCGNNFFRFEDSALEPHSLLARNAESHAASAADFQRELAPVEDREVVQVFAGSEDDDFRVGRRYMATGTDDFEELLQKLLSKSRSCRFVLNPYYTYGGISAAVKTGDADATDDPTVYWSFVMATGTPKSEMQQISAYLQEFDIHVYGEDTCSITRGMHQELNDMEVEHTYTLFSSEDEETFHKMMEARRQATDRVVAASSYPIIIIENTSYNGFSSAVALYRAMNQNGE